MGESSWNSRRRRGHVEDRLRANGCWCFLAWRGRRQSPGRHRSSLKSPGCPKATRPTRSSPSTRRAARSQSGLRPVGGRRFCNDQMVHSEQPPSPPRIPMLRLEPLVVDSPSRALFDRFVPPDHPLRQFDDALDFSFVLPLVAERYHNEIGRTAEHPEQLFRLLVAPFRPTTAPRTTSSPSPAARRRSFKMPMMATASGSSASIAAVRLPDSLASGTKTT